MKRFYFFIALLCIIFMITILGCPPGPEPEPTPTPVPDFPDEDAESTYTGSGDEVFHIETVEGDVDLTHTLHLGTSTADVYYVFTNTDPYDEHFNPFVDYDKAAGYEPLERVPLKEPGMSGPYPIYGKPEITKFNENVTELMKKGKAAKGQLPSLERVNPPEDVGDPYTFKYDTSIPTIPAVCRAKVELAGYKTLYIYVANDCWWDGGTKTYKVTQTMVNQMAAKYLQADPDNDINDWDTTIFGEEWESYANTTYPTMFIEDDDDVTILLYDIDNDNVPTGGFIAGFFWAKDNFYADYNEQTSHSNERIMFYIDAVMYAYDDGSWSINDYYPSIMISTLAHEAQHMIHFYQKVIVSGNGLYLSETWLNEMCSVTTEDLLSNKIQTDGPRGVAYNDGSAGSSGNIDGRLPRFNSTNDYSLTTWNGQLYNYSTVYSYGAYLARNYGGVELFQEIVQSQGVDYSTIDDALDSLGYTEDFADTLQKWGASILLSDNLTPPAGYEYNSGDYFDSTFDSVLYFNLGSINFYNYTFDTQVGPYIYTTSPVGDEKHDEFLSASNRLYLVGENLTGNVTHTVKMEDGVKLTVVVKE